MRGFRNSTAALAILAALSLPAVAQDGSGIPRDPSQDGSTPRPPERGGSVSVPPPPVGTIGNPSPPSGGNDNYLPDELPVAGQPGEIAEQGDGAFDPAQPALLSPGSDSGPDNLPYGQTPEEISRAQQILANPAGTGMTPSEVEVRPLGKPDPSDKGTLAEGEGGFGGELWADSDYATIADLMAEMPAGTPSPAMNELIRRVLLTGATPKERGDDGPTLYDLRTARLLDAGLVRDLAALLDLGDEKAGDPAARQQGYLLAAREREACAALSDDAADASALMMRALCQIAVGDGAAAAMSADLARVKGAHDAAFFALVAHLADGAPLDAAALTKLNPVTLALARRAKAELTPLALDGATLGVAAALAGSKSTPTALRIAAATRAASDGALDPAMLLDLVLAAKDAGAFASVRTAIQTEGLEPRAKAIAGAVTAGAAEDRTMLTAALLARAAWETTPSAALAAYAAPVTRVLLLTGRGDRVADWLNFASALPTGVGEEIAVQLALAAPSKDRTAKASEALARLAALSAADAGLQTRVLIYAGALDAMGQSIPETVHGLLAASPQFAGGSGQVETAELAAAAREKRVGETILRALILIGQGGPAKANPAAVIEAVAALSRVGLTREAAQIALEAALARPVGGGG